MNKNNYILNTNKVLELKNQLIFICGPAIHNDSEYSKHKKVFRRDRREILKEYLAQEYENVLFGLIIDNFVLVDSFIDPQTNLKFMEEIIAEISYLTMNFLDTMSAAVELGLFASYSTASKQVVLLPDTNDVVFSGNGFFTESVINLHNNAKLNYKPAVNQYFSSNHDIQRRLFFLNDKVPKNVEEYIFNHKEGEEKHKISLIGGDSEREKWDIQYVLNEDEKECDVVIPVIILFRIIAELTDHHDYETVISTQTLNELMNVVKLEVEKIILRTINVEMGLKINRVHLKINNSESRTLDDVTKIILEFLKLFHTHEDNRKSLFTTTILEKKTNKDSFVLINLDDSTEIEMLLKVLRIEELYNNFVNSHVVDYTEMHKSFISIFGLSSVIQYKAYKLLRFKKKNKIKKFMTYNDSVEGMFTREVHHSLKKYFDRFYTFNNNSYAYRKNTSIRMCVEEHLHSKSFYKFDIKNFFTSIDSELLNNKLLDFMGIVKTNRWGSKAIDFFQFKNNTPIGFVSSPYLSDLYLNDFDECLSQKCLEEDLIYTRYSDDIMISSCDESYDFTSIKHQINTKLSELGLKINKKKELERSFKNSSSIKYIGLNIVKGPEKNFVSVSKSYALRIVAQLKYLNEGDSSISKSQILGKINYIKFIDERRLKNIFIQLDQYSKNNVLNNDVKEIYEFIKESI